MGRIKEYNRELVIEKAKDAFWKYGFKNTTARVLENEMGINQNTIYTEFENKETLFIETLKCYENQLNKSVLKPVIESEGHLEDIRSFFNQFVNDVKNGEIKNGCLLTNTTVDFGDSNTQVKRYIDQFYERLFKYFSQLLIKSQVIGELPKTTDINKLAIYLIGCTQGLKVIIKVVDSNALKNYIDTVIASLK